jgi:hypothetical protein
MSKYDEKHGYSDEKSGDEKRSGYADDYKSSGAYSHAYAYDDRASSKYDDDFLEAEEGEGKIDSSNSYNNPPKVDITQIDVNGDKMAITSPLDLRITFTLDRDVVCANWAVKFLVDSAESRLIKILGETPVEDYPDGESDMTFTIDYVDVSDITPSTLTNSGLLIATFRVDGDEVANVNLVVNVFKDKSSGEIMREIFNPLA